MKACTHYKYGSPDVLQYENIEQPTPKEGQVLVRVKATTINRTDCAMLRAKPFIMRFMTGLLRPKNRILGTSFSGTIEAVSNGVSHYQVGDDVFGFNDMGVSSYAEYLVIDASKNLTKMPTTISYEQAAASIEGEHYAYNMINKTNLKAGDKVLINGADGAIGSAALQLSKALGAVVTVTCRTQNIALMEKLGADHIIDYTQQDFTQLATQYNFVFDSIGKSSFGRCKPVLSKQGVYISSEPGWMAQNIFFALMKPIIGSKKVVFPIPLNVAASLALVKKLIENNQHTAVIDREYEFQHIAEAFRYVETGQKTGNVVIKIQSSDSEV